VQRKITFLHTTHINLRSISLHLSRISSCAYLQDRLATPQLHVYTANMADTQPAAEAPATNPAEATASNESAQAVANPGTAENAKPSDKESANGTAEAGKEAEESTKEKDDRSNGRPFDNRRGGRGGRGGGRFGGNKQFRKCVDLMT
jgi:uncharacterized membrane protein